MKKLYGFLIISMMSSGISVFSQNDPSLQGAWEMVYQKWTFEEEVREYTEFENPSVKVYSIKHFSLGRLGDRGEFVGHLGTYTFDGKTYVEDIDYSSYPYARGMSIKYKSKIKKDSLHMEGTLVVNGQEAKLEEIWKRLE